MVEEWSPRRTSRFGGSKNHFHLQLKSALPMGVSLSSVKTWPNFFPNCIPSLVRVEQFYYKGIIYLIVCEFPHLHIILIRGEGFTVKSTREASPLSFPLSTPLSLLWFGLWLSSHPRLPLMPVNIQHSSLILPWVHSLFHSVVFISQAKRLIGFPDNPLWL